MTTVTLYKHQAMLTVMAYDRVGCGRRLIEIDGFLGLALLRLMALRGSMLVLILLDLYLGMLR